MQQFGSVSQSSQEKKKKVGQERVYTFYIYIKSNDVVFYEAFSCLCRSY